MSKRPGNIFLHLLRICFLVLPVLCTTALFAQDTTKAEYLRGQQPDNRADSAQLFRKDADSARLFRQDTPLVPAIVKPVHSPGRAALLSAVLPGLGQAYNRQYWKIPLVYAALGTCTGVFIFNMDQYTTYRNAYRIRMDGNEDTKDAYEGLYSDASLKILRDGYRQYVDYSVLVFVLAYGLNIIDATVFAHLKSFDMSDDLSMKIVPTVIDNRAIGFSLRVNLSGGKSSRRSGSGQLALGRW